MVKNPTIPPVLVLSTGRCGSTMVSNIPSLHPRVLSPSESLTCLGLKTFRPRRPSGEWMWKLYSRQSYRTRLLLKEPFDKLQITDFAAYWSTMIGLAHDVLGDLPSDRLLKLKLEDMQAAPEAQLRRLIRFIDPALEDEVWIQEASTIPSQTPSKFAKPDADEQAATTEACRPGLVRLGYAV